MKHLLAVLRLLGRLCVYAGIGAALGYAYAEWAMRG